MNVDQEQDKDGKVGAFRSYLNLKFRLSEPAVSKQKTLRHAKGLR